MLLSSLIVFLVFTSAGSHARIRTTECAKNDCSHDCTVVGGSQVCTCPDNMILGPDSKTCQEPVSVLLAMYRGVRVFTEGKSVDELPNVLAVRATTFDYHYSNKEIFAFANDSILRASLLDPLEGVTSSPKTVVKPTTSVTSLAVDWVHDELYWICRQKSAIEAITIGSNKTRTIVSPGEAASLEDSAISPGWNNLVIDPFVGRLFWISPRGIYSSDLSGKYNETSSRLQLEDIVLDIEKQLIYVIGTYATDGHKAVLRSNYDGSNSVEVLRVDQRNSKVFGFGIFKNVLYWQSNYDGENLYKCEIPGVGEKANIKLVEELNQIVYEMKVYHPEIQPRSRR